MEQKVPKQVKVSTISLLAILILSLAALAFTIFQGSRDNQTDPAPQSDIYVKEGAEDLQNQDFSSAIENYDKAIEIDPTNTQAYAEKSEAEYAAGDKEAAKETIEEGLKQDPDNELLKSRLDVLENNNPPNSNLDNIRE